MKAIVQEGSGSADVLHLRDIQRPDLPDDRVLVRVRAASVNALDWHTVHGGRLVSAVGFLLRQPTFPIRGADLSGHIEAVGKDVTRLRPGDAVFGTARGTFAEFAIAREDRLVPKPPQLSFAQAGAMGVAALTALQGLRDRGQVTPGTRVLIHGAGGGVGTFAVQIAKALGGHVTAVTSTRNLELVRSMGPDEVIDYTKDDFTRRPDCRRVLRPNGRIVLTGAAKGGMVRTLSRALAGIVRSRYFGSRWLVPFLASVTYEDLMVLKELVEAGKVCPVIDREYTLSETAEAVRYVGSGEARAKVVITVA